MSWRLLDRFLLRRAGFPFELVSPLAASGAGVPTAEALAAEAEGEELRGRLLSEDFPGAVGQARAREDRNALRVLSRWRRGVGRRTADAVPSGEWPNRLVERFRSWRDAAARAERHWQEAAAALEADIESARGALRRLADREDIREAIFLSSPEFHAQLDRRIEPGTRQRAFERRLYMFVQRFAAKNETASFFGPLTHGRLEGDGDGLELGPADELGYSRREVFFAFWAAAALGRAIAADPQLRERLPLRRRPVVEVEGSRARLPGRPSVDLSPVDSAVLTAAGGRGATTAAIATSTGLPESEVAASVVNLERNQLASRDVEPRSTTPHPLEDISAALPEGAEGDGWRAEIEEHRAALRRFAAAPLDQRLGELEGLERRFTEITSLPARRKGGEVYADRQLIYEDCCGDLEPVHMGAALGARLERELAPVLDFAGAYGAARHAALEGLATEVVRGGGGEVGFLAFAARLRKAVEEGGLKPRLEEARRIASAVAAAVAAGSGGGAEAVLEAEDLRRIAEPPARPLFASPDVMLEARGGGRPPGFVLGEVQPYVFAWGSQAQFADHPEALQEAMRPAWDVWEGPGRMATVVNRRRHKGLLTEAFPGRLIEVTAYASHDEARCTGVAELRVAYVDGRIELRGPDGPLTLYAGEDELPHLQVFAPPLVEWPRIRTGERTPRITVGEVVAQRGRWDPPAEALAAIAAAPSGFPLWRAVAAAREADGWPRRVFAHAPGEPKPIFLDLEVPFAQEELRRLAAGGPVSLVEMLPAPERLELVRMGHRYTSELRLAMVRS